MGSKHTSVILPILITAYMLCTVKPVDSTAEQSNAQSYFLGEVRSSRINGRKPSSEDFGQRESKAFDSDSLGRVPRVNSRRFSKELEGELDNSTVAAFENNTLEEAVSSTTTDGAISYFPSRSERPSGKVEEENTRTPGGSAGTSVKPTKYHYYPHNQHIYLLPECAVQQVCNAVYVRLNFTQPLCACPSRYREPCSASINSDDYHTTELSTDPKGKVLTLVKTCEPVLDMRLCRSPRDWSLLALQNIRTGKSHYLVICRCPETSVLEGPMAHDQPTYASVPGIRVYGMMCVSRPVDTTPSTIGLTVAHYRTTNEPATQTASQRKSRPLALRERRSLKRRFYEGDPEFPWHRVSDMLNSLRHQELYS